MKCFKRLLVVFVLFAVSACSLLDNDTRSYTISGNSYKVSYKQPKKTKVFKNFHEDLVGAIYTNMDEENMKLYYEGQAFNYPSSGLRFFKTNFYKLEGLTKEEIFNDYIERLEENYRDSYTSEELEINKLPALKFNYEFDDFGTFAYVIYDKEHDTESQIMCDYIISDNIKSKIEKDCSVLAKSLKIK